MNYKLVLRVIGMLLLCEAVLMIPSLGVAMIYRDGDTMAFVISMLVTAGCGLLPTLLARPEKNDMNAKDGMAVAGLSWILLSAFGSLPFILSGAIPHVADAFFETVSGFTTTGATILTQIEGLPRGVLFWRSFTHWIGGMGILIFTLAVLPRLTGRTTYMARAESPGPTFSKLLPRMGDTAKVLYGIYMALTVLLLLCLLLAGMSPYDALIHAFSTAGTGGFSNYNASVASFGSPAIEWIIAVFMMLFGVNFALYFHLLRREFGQALRNEELWVYGGLVVLSTAGITAAILPQVEGGFMTALRQAFFQTTAIVSTTGFVTADFDVWPGIAQAILLLLMCFGACAGSTAGGFKLSRVLLLAKSTYREMRHTLQPRKVSVVRVDGKVASEETLSQLGVYLFLYIIVLFVCTLLLAMQNIDILSALTAALTCISNVGPGLRAVGPTQNFAFMTVPAKYLCSFLMLAGRLEIYPILLLFSANLWRKN